ncbi:hypothetical protein [Pedobacter gandavensis]|uniref:hypothetical protein n=1 Tax=Pedobacter gandavensis TaxID=2679963 RepID=UPI00292CBD31|nr:hypothetical protein [Pedobacter gandavensis]
MRQKTEDARRLSHYDQQRGDFKRLMPIVKEALLHKVWLYNKSNGNWYTPEEFQEKYANKEFNNYQITNILENMIMRDPKGGNTAYHKAIELKIEQHHKEINELRSKGESFLNKVIDYYQRKR